MHHGYIERRLINLLAGRPIPSSLVSVAELIYSRPLDFVNARKYPADLFADVRVFCMFVGYPRSGHSLIAQLLDAHPHIIISNEMDVLGHVARGFDQTQIFSLILNNSRMFALRGSKGLRYSYSIPGQWQGKFKSLRCIGDKKGGRSAQRLAHDPSLIDQLVATVDKKMRLIHVVRNPYDNIATLAVRKRTGSLAETIDYYFTCVDGVLQASNSLPKSSFLTIKHEAFIRNPRTVLASLCDYLEQEAPSDYLEASSELVFESPHKSRNRIDWADGSIQTVREQIEKRNCDFLAGYAFVE